jgi:protein-tyrosine phosphatase
MIHIAAKYRCCIGMYAGERNTGETVMVKVMFVCYGNICRSPMAEFIFRDMVNREGLGEQFDVRSSATSREEIGNPVHRGSRKKLAACGISTDGKTAVQLRREDYDIYDYIIGMEQRNVTDILRIVGGDPAGKVYRLLDFSRPRDIADPWYTGDFDSTYNDIIEGCSALLKGITKRFDLTLGR